MVSGDQLGGGFARYSVDADWVVPHFEKMLYDNAAAAGLRALGPGAPATRWPAGGRGDGRFPVLRPAQRRGVHLVAGRRCRGRRGLDHVWTPAQLNEVLGPDDGAWAATVFGVSDEGTFEHGTSVLQLPADHDPCPGSRAFRRSVRPAGGAGDRPQPPRDDKVVTAWNGLAITALAEASVALDDPGSSTPRCAAPRPRRSSSGRRPTPAGQPRWGGR